MTSVSDLYPHLIRRGHRRELLLLFVCIVCFLLGLVMVTPVSGWVCGRGVHDPPTYLLRNEVIFRLLCARLSPPNVGWPVCVPDLRPLLLQWSQPAAARHLPVCGHRLDLRYKSQLLSLYLLTSSLLYFICSLSLCRASLKFSLPAPLLAFHFFPIILFFHSIRPPPPISLLPYLSFSSVLFLSLLLILSSLLL